ncbi:MAG: hypothetical protein HN936_02345, partial [Bacteroidetes bacterium]|nr:hypothetical protein [Bacteroidota bacterium]
MKFLKLYFPLSASFLILFACSQPDTASKYETINHDEVLVCDLSKVGDTVEIALSNLIDNCDMIQLETHPDAFFDRAWHT